ncbi:apolipoprotein N-acyltransferase [uncultured Marinobacter sp.]|uniref:apolipoprotein N-acyltransferase n=1 Tax=uncultured Marinobacter sp. TaxID=187379 RepID=UPI0030DB8A07
MTPPNNPMVGATVGLVLAVASGLLLALVYSFPSCYLVAWIALVPLLGALEGRSLAGAYGLGLVTGLMALTGAAWWIMDFIVLLKGYGPLRTAVFSGLFWVYGAQMIGLLALAIVFGRRHRILPEIVLIPVLVTLFFGSFPMLFQSNLGETQSLFLTAIQGADLTGAIGLDAVIGLVNLLVYRLLIRARPVRWQELTALCLVLIWFGYGGWQLSKWSGRVAAAVEDTSRHPVTRIGLVQPGALPVLTPEPPKPGYSLSYPPAMAISEQLVDAGAEVVMWSESRFVLYFENEHVQRAYQQQVRRMSVPLLFQDMEYRNDAQGRMEFNTALMLDHGGAVLGDYQKVKRVAFGEYIPLVENFPALRRQVIRFFGGFTATVAQGPGPARFDVRGVGIIPLICYEAMFPEFVASAVSEVSAAPDQDESPRILTVLSNNAWFGDSRQPFQHFHSVILRAVENRLPLVHVMNNGPSGVITPDGRIHFQSPLGGEKGYLAEVPHVAESQTGRTLFGRYPGWFTGLMFAILMVGITNRLVWLLLPVLRRRKA